MPLYVGDYLADTAALDNTAHGAYLLLILSYWSTGCPLPNDDEQLWRIARCRSKKAWLRLRPLLERFFMISQSQLTHSRVEKELAISRARFEKRSLAGKRAATERWQNENNANRTPIASQDACESHASHSHSHRHSHHSEIHQPPASEAAKAVAAHYVKMRSELWPTEARADLRTAIKHASEHLASGATSEIIIEVITRGLERRASSGKSAPATLRYFRHSLKETLTEKRADARHVDGKTASFDGDASRWRARLVSFAGSGRWIAPAWPTNPDGSPDLRECPVALLAEYRQQLEAKGIKLPPAAEAVHR